MDNPTNSLPYLPPEMYEEIFSNVSGEDFLSVINANADWDDLLWDRKNTALFPMVLNILTEDRRYLKPEDLLPCRLVHSDWKSAVDSTMARDPHKYFRQHFSISWESEAFVNHTLRLQSGNPFLGRYLGLRLDDLQMTPVLERFGSHLETLTLNLDWEEEGEPPYDFLRRLSSVLALTPHVRDLTLDMWIEYPEVPPIQPLRELAPLPQLRKLDISRSALFFHSHQPDDYIPILETVIVEAYGATLSELKCSPYLFQNEGVQHLFPNLRKLIVTNDANLKGLSNQGLRVLAGFHTTMLENLYIELGYWANFSPEIVNVIANFPTLKSLSKIPMPRANDALEAISGIKELTMKSNQWSSEAIQEEVLAIVHVMSHTFPDLELLTITFKMGSNYLNMNRESVQALFDGLKKLKSIYFKDRTNQLTFTR